MRQTNEITREEDRNLVYFRILVIIGILYILTFLTSDADHMPTIAETLKFTFHMLKRFGDLFLMIGKAIHVDGPVGG